MKSLLLIAICSISGHLFSQFGSDTLDHNNTSATISNYGTFLQEVPGSLSGYEVPKGSGLHPIYGLQFWFGGIDNGGALHTALGGTSTEKDFFNGPYSTTGQYSEPEYSEPFIVTICQEDIDNYILWWNCSDNPAPVDCDSVIDPSNAVLNTINNWPANGNVSTGQSLDLAPYFDNDSNGIYDPAAGDYPIIKGCCATYVIQNDHSGVHTYSGTDPIGIETHYMFYQYASGDYLNEATFVDVLAINYGTTNYPEFAHGVMLDADLGNYGDDYFGSDSLTSTLYFYNGDNFDDGAYLSNPPAIGITALDQNATSCVGMQSFGFAVTNWNLMNGNQISGSSFLNPSGQPTSYQFSGNPNNPAEWNETSAGSISGDRKGVMSTIHGNFAPGDEIRQSYAILYARVGDHLENANEIINQAGQAKLFYDVTGYSTCETSVVASLEEEENISVTLYPNPVTNQLTIENRQEIQLSVGLYNAIGEEVITPFLTDDSEISINTSHLTEGVYFVRLNSDSGHLVQRIIVMN